VRKLAIALVLVLVIGAVGCEGGEGEPTPTPTATLIPTPTPTPIITPLDGGEMALSLSSSAFQHGERIPVKYTCDGQDISLPLEWSNVPQGTQSLALIADDPDAPVGTWIHWVLYNLPGDSRALHESVPPDASLPNGSRHGKNSWGQLGYGGPCPPSGTHRYFFKLYALDTILELQAGASKDQLLEAMERHILADAELMGSYSR
jgi:Raf kinase inhibitor-like YbhB/YbcL family protein